MDQGKNDMDHDHQTFILLKHNCDVRKLDLHYLIGCLNSHELLTSRDFEMLTDCTKPSQDRLDKLLTILPKKGSNFLYKFIDALRECSSEEDPTPKSHKEIADKLEKEIAKTPRPQDFGRSQSYPISHEALDCSVPRKSHSDCVGCSLSHCPTIPFSEKNMIKSNKCSPNQALQEKAVVEHSYSGIIENKMVSCGVKLLPESEHVLMSQLSITPLEDTPPIAGACAAGEQPNQQEVTSALHKQSFKHLNTKLMPISDQEGLKGRLEREFESISSAFANFHNSICRSLKSNITPEDLVNELRGMNASPVRRNADISDLIDQYDELRNKDNIDRIFDILVKYMSFFSFEILKNIICAFGTDNDKRQLEEYTKKLEQFCRRNVFECPWSEGDEAASDQTKLIVKIDESNESYYSVKSLRKLCVTISEILNISGCFLRVRNVEKGCIEITFLIPKFIEKNIFPLKDEQQKRFQSIGVTRLVCGFYSFDKRKQESYKPFESGDLMIVEGWAQKKPIYQQKREPSKPFCCAYYLQGKCRSRNCDYNHDVTPLSKPYFKYVPYPHPHPRRSPIGKKGRDPHERKCYMIIKSDQDPENEVKVVAETEGAIQHAEDILHKLFQESQHEVHRKEKCVKFQLLGECAYGSKCKYEHSPGGRTYEGYVPHPVGQMSGIFKKTIGKFGLTPSGGCYTTKWSRRNPDKEVEVIADSPEALEYGKSSIKKKLVCDHFMKPLCYIHPDGLEIPSTIQFHELERGSRRYSIDLVKPEVSSCKVTRSKVEDMMNLNTIEHEEVRSVLIKNPEQATNMKYNMFTRITPKYYEEIQDHLHDALEQLQMHKAIPKVEGRIGKLTWKQIPSDVSHAKELRVSEFLPLLFKHEGYRRSFEARVNDDSVSSLVHSGILDYTGSTIETYDFKISATNRGRFDIRVQFCPEKPTVLMVKIDENKGTIFDILCFHRNHDIRLALSNYSVLPADDPLVVQFLSTCSLSKTGHLSFECDTPLWQVKLIRKKSRQAYYLKDIPKNYVLTITTVHSHETSPSDLSSKEAITIVFDEIAPKSEVELHNLKWECAFSRSSSPAEALVSIIDVHCIQFDISNNAKFQWSPNSIVSEFQDDFIQILETINDLMK